MTQRDQLHCTLLFPRRPEFHLEALETWLADAVDGAVLEATQDGFVLANQEVEQRITATIIERRPGALKPLYEADQALVEDAEATTWQVDLVESGAEDEHPMERVGVMMGLLVALAEQQEFLAAYSPQSGVLMEREEMAEAPMGLIYALRLYGDPKQAVFLDTVGLDVLGLQDLQTSFRGLEAEDVADLLGEIAEEMVTEGFTWDDEPEQIEGLKGDPVWTIAETASYLPPERPVATVTVGERFRAPLPQ